MIEHPDRNHWHIAIAVPSHDMCPATFAFDLANMMAHTASTLHGRVAFSMHTTTGTYIHRAREQLVREIYAIGANYILWIDSDMRFPKDALLQLLARDLPVVGANYSTRSVPSRFVAIKRVGIDHKEDGLGGANCPTLEESTGVEPVEALGFGFMLMKAVVLDSLDPDIAWFAHTEPGKEGFLGQHLGEDVWFCRLVREGGWDVYVDHDLSKEIRHVGQLEYRWQHAADRWLAEEAVKAESGDTEVTTGAVAQKVLEMAAAREKENEDVDRDVQRAADGGGELAGQVGPDSESS